MSHLGIGRLIILVLYISLVFSRGSRAEPLHGNAEPTVDRNANDKTAEETAEETAEASLHGAIGELTPLDQAVMSAWLTKLTNQQKKDKKNGLSREEQQKNLEKNLKELQKEVSGTLAKEQINQQTEAIKTLLQQLLERSQSKR